MEKRVQDFLSTNIIRKHYTGEKSRITLADRSSFPSCLICKLCNGILEQPQRVKCGYTFCKLCNEKARKNNQKKCTHCGTKEKNCFEAKFCVKNFAISDIIDDLGVLCPKCQKDVKFGKLDDHVKSCKGLVRKVEKRERILRDESDSLNRQNKRISGSMEEEGIKNISKKCENSLGI